MKYKLLVQNGIHFVCLEDGTKIPYQVSSIVTQMNRNAATVEVVVLCRTVEAKDSWPVFKHGGLYMNGARLAELDKVWFKPDYGIHNSGVCGQCNFTVDVELIDTIETPKTIYI
jgi:hypothetical protein